MSSSENLHESLSALMDGEATELELRRLLKSEDESLNKRWQSYHLISAAMKGESLQMPLMDVSAAVSASLEDEPTYTVKTKPSRFLSNLGRFSVAASVAGAMVVGVQFLQTQTTVNTIADTAPSAPAATTPVFDGNTSVRTVSQEPAPIAEKPTIIINEATQQQLEVIGGEVNRLILEHAQHASQNTQQGVLPYVRVPDSEQQ